MRMMLTAIMPNEPFNTLVRENKAGALITRVLQDLKPEAVYFTEEHGKRAMVLIIDVADPSKFPSFAEPFLMRGSYHVLANTLKIGWHPAFKERFAHALEVAVRSVE